MSDRQLFFPPSSFPPRSVQIKRRCAEAVVAVDLAAAALQAIRKTSRHPRQMVNLRVAAASAAAKALRKAATLLLAAAAASAADEAVPAAAEVADAVAADVNSTVNPPIRNLASEDPTNAMEADEAIGDPTRMSSTTNFKPRPRPPLPTNRLLRLPLLPPKARRPKPRRPKEKRRPPRKEKENRKKPRSRNPWR